MDTHPRNFSPRSDLSMDCGAARERAEKPVAGCAARLGSTCAVALHSDSARPSGNRRAHLETAAHMPASWLLTLGDPSIAPADARRTKSRVGPRRVSEEVRYVSNDICRTLPSCRGCSTVSLSDGMAHATRPAYVA